MGLLSNKSWGATSGSKGWKSAQDAQKYADKKNGKNQSEFARRKAAAKKGK